MAAPADLSAASQAARCLRASTAWAKTPAGGVTLLILTTFLARLLFAASLGLGIDESYMVAAGRQLRLGYFDHPPIAWWLAWAAAHLAGSDSPIVVRLPFIALFALTTWLMYRVTAALFGARAGLWAAVLANLCPVIGVTAGTWVLPDGPLFAALLGATLCLIAALPSEGRAAWGWWLGAGLCAGLALSSKYSAALTILGAIVFLLTERESRRWLLRPHPYVAGLAALAVFMPVLIWNARHGWVSFLFQGGRAEGRFNPLGPVLTLAGGALVSAAVDLVAVDRVRVQCAAPGTGRQRTLAPGMPGGAADHLLHADLAAEPGAVSLGRTRLSDAVAAARRRDRPSASGAAGGSRRPQLLSSSVRRSSAARYGSTGCRWRSAIFGSARTPALAAVDWTSLRQELDKRGLLDRPGLVVAATRWLDAGKIDYALGGRVPVICLGSDPREYGIIAPVAEYAGADVLIVAPRCLAGRQSPPALANFSIRSTLWRRPRCCMTGARH